MIVSSLEMTHQRLWRTLRVSFMLFLSKTGSICFSLLMAPRASLERSAVYVDNFAMFQFRQKVIYVTPIWLFVLCYYKF